jgi:hypothetical protein
MSEGSEVNSQQTNRKKKADIVCLLMKDYLFMKWKQSEFKKKSHMAFESTL